MALDEDRKDALDGALDQWAHWMLRGRVRGLGYPTRSTLARIIDQGPNAAASAQRCIVDPDIGLSPIAAKMVRAIDHLGESPLGNCHVAALVVHYLGAHQRFSARVALLDAWLVKRGQRSIYRALSKTGYYERLNRAREALDDVLWRMERAGDPDRG